MNESEIIIKNRNTNLDLLRVLAVMMIVTVHVGYQLPWINDYTWYGYYGNLLFFVLSGYLITASVKKSKSIKDYYKKRVIRIVPLYWFVLIVIYISNLIRGTVLGVKFLRYFVFLQMILPSDDFGTWNNMRGLWCMTLFMFFYIIAPLVVKVVRRFYVALIVFVVMLFCHDPFVRWFENFIVRIYPNISEAYNYASWSPLSMLYLFVGGVLIYYAVEEEKEMIVIILAAISMIYNSFTWFAWDLAMIIMVICAVKMPELCRHEKARKAISSFSDFSFPIYLTHITVIGWMMGIQDVLVPIIRHKGFLVLMLVSIVFIGYLAWKFIEQPLIRGTNKLLEKCFTKNTN